MTTTPRFFLAALGLALAGATNSFAQTLLDDFSSDRFATHYEQKNVPGFALGGWQVIGGALRPDSINGVGGYAAFVWTSHALQQAGDWFSIELTVAAAPGDQNAGLSVWRSSDGATFDRAFEPRLGYNSTYAFVGSDSEGEQWVEGISSGAVTSPMLLRITLTAVTEAGSELNFSLHNSAGPLVSRNYTIANHTGPLYVGPSAWQATGTNVAFDNLTYYSSAIPEPSTYAALTGLLALGAVAWRRGKRATGKTFSAS